MCLYGALIGSVVDAIGDDRWRQQHDPRHRQQGGADRRSWKMRSSPSRSASSPSSPRRMAISSTLRLHQEESSQRGETVLAGAVGRIRWAASHILVRHRGAGGGDTRRRSGRRTHLRHRQRRRRREDCRPCWPSQRCSCPPSGCSRRSPSRCSGCVPRFTPVAWGVLVAFIALYLLGSLAGLPHWLINLQPFTHAQRTPGQTLRRDTGDLAAVDRRGAARRRVARLPAPRSALTDEPVAELRQPGAGPRVVHQCRGAGRRKAEVLARAQARVDELIGLDGPKEQIAVWRTEIQIDQLLAAQGEETSSTNENHMVLEGSPGTAKTSTTRTPHPAVREVRCARSFWARAWASRTALSR